MKTYEITFVFDGKVYREQITGHNPQRIRELIRARYSGAKIMHVKEIK